MAKKQEPTFEILAACKAIDAGVPIHEVMRRLEAVHIKGDPCEGFTGSLPFHLNREPPSDHQRGTRVVIVPKRPRP